MVLYILMIVTFVLDLVTMKKSGNSNDKIPYIISMIIVCVLGVFYLKYGDDLQLIDRLFRLVGLQGGV